MGPIARYLNALRMELRDALRSLRAGHGTTIVAFLLLTLAMTAATVTFSIVDAVALRRLPFASPDRLVDIAQPGHSAGLLSAVSPQQYFEWRERTQAFESIGAARMTAPLQLEEAGLSETLSTRRVTANLFEVLGIQPAAGRLFDPDHEKPGGPSGVILSHALWMRRFGGDPGVIGRRLTFGRETRQVVGVLPAGVWYPITAGSPPDLFVPYIVTAAERANNRALSMSVVGRVRDGVTLDQARADVVRVSTSAVVVQPLRQRVVGTAKTWLLLALAAVGILLLVACVNVASLLLARGAARVREFATRLALGASRRRLAVGLVLEGLILGLACGAAALAVSYWGLAVATSNLPSGLARVSTIAIDSRVMAVSIAAAVLCGVLFGTAPAWLAARTDLLGLMKAGGTVIGGRGRDRSLTAFLVADIAFVTVLLVATALVVTSFIVVTTSDLGFDRRNVMTVSFERSLGEVASDKRPAAAAALRAELLTRARSVPGVAVAAIAQNATAPMSGGSVRYSMTIPGFGETPREDWLETNMVTPDYFDVMGMDVVQGRMFVPSDTAGAPLVMIINDAAARRFFQGRSPVGEVVTFNGPTTIVGVLRGVRFDGPEADVRPAMYTPLDQQRVRGATVFGSLVVRTTSDPKEIAGALREAVRPALAAEPSQPQFVDDYFRRATAGRRFNATLMASLGFIALAIGALGIYGTMAYVVARQVRAIGLRMALGASPGQVMRSVLNDALRRVAIGTTIGLLAAWALSGALVSFVFGVKPTEPVVYAVVGCFLAVVGVAAALIPALRASRLDPLVVMRHE